MNIQNLSVRMRVGVGALALLVLAAASSAQTIDGKPEVKAGTGQDVAFGANSQGFYALWSTPAGIEMHAPNAAKTTRLSDVGAFPAIVTLPDGGMLAAWEENGAITTARF